MLSSSIIGAISFDGETANAVANVLSEESIPQFSLAIDGFRNGNEVPLTGNRPTKDWHSVANTILQTVPSMEDQVKALFDVVRNLAWKHVIVFYDDSSSGSADRDLFVQLVQETDVCIGAQIRVNKFGQGGGGETADLHSLLEAIDSDLPVLSVAVLLLDTTAQVQHVLSVLQDVGLAKRFIVVSNQAWGSNTDLLFEVSTRQLAGALTVSMETYPVDNFNRFMADLSLTNHSSIPEDWFQEYYQHYFECHLLHSHVMQKMYPKQCTGDEQFNAKDIEQDPYVYHTILAVETYVKALREFLQVCE